MDNSARSAIDKLSVQIDEIDARARGLFRQQQGLSSTSQRWQDLDAARFALYDERERLLMRQDELMETLLQQQQQPDIDAGMARMFKRRQLTVLDQVVANRDAIAKIAVAGGLTDAAMREQMILFAPGLEKAIPSDYAFKARDIGIAAFKLRGKALEKELKRIIGDAAAALPVEAIFDRKKADGDDWLAAKAIITANDAEFKERAQRAASFFGRDFEREIKDVRLEWPQLRDIPDDAFRAIFKASVVNSDDRETFHDLVSKQVDYYAQSPMDRARSKLGKKGRDELRQRLYIKEGYAGAPELSAAVVYGDPDDDDDDDDTWKYRSEMLLGAPIKDHINGTWRATYKAIAEAAEKVEQSICANCGEETDLICIECATVLCGEECATEIAHAKECIGKQIRIFGAGRNALGRGIGRLGGGWGNQGGGWGGYLGHGRVGGYGRRRHLGILGLLPVLARRVYYGPYYYGRGYPARLYYNLGRAAFMNPRLFNPNYYYAYPEYRQPWVTVGRYPVRLPNWRLDAAQTGAPDTVPNWTEPVWGDQRPDNERWLGRAGEL